MVALSDLSDSSDKPSPSRRGYVDLIAQQDSSIGSLHWKDLFKDSLLQQLIQEGINNNLDLKTAYSRIIQATAYLKQSERYHYPSLDADARIEFAKKMGNATGVSHVH